MNGNDYNSNNLTEESLVNSLTLKIKDFEYNPELDHSLNFWYHRY